jgi:hypothetical protein
MNNVESLITLWNALFPDYTPPKSQFALWIEMNGQDITRQCIVATGKKYLSMDCTMTPEHMTRYASACMVNRKNHTARSTGGAL